jgi:hypothetical protein
MKIIQKNKNRTEQRQSLPENGAATIAAKEVKEEKKTATLSIQHRAREPDSLATALAEC